jgi:hypothetical protein
MFKRHTRTLWVLLSIVAGVGVEPVAALAADGDDGAWHFHVVPYLWLPAVDSSAKLTISELPLADGTEIGPISLKAATRPGDYLSNLNMAFMFLGEARKGPWSVYTDVLYTSFGNEDTKVRSVTGPAGFLSTEIGSKAKTSLSTTLWTLTGGYRAVERDNFQLDLMAGTRYLTMDSDLKLTLQGADGRFFRQQKYSLDQDVWQGVVGLRGQILFPGSHWFVPYYADVGSGGSNWSWQAMLGVGYQFDWGEVTLAYRALGYEFDQNDADMTLYGPGLGVGFRW